MSAATYYYPPQPPVKAPVKPYPVVMVSQDTHSKVVGYLLWLIGFSGAHRFYYGKPLTGILWLCTFGLFGIGWLIDAFLIPAMDDQANYNFAPGPHDYNLIWIVLIFAGGFGVHRMVMGKWVTGIVYLCTFGLFGLGLVYDVLTLNFQIDSEHRRRLNLA